jgi:EAL domain-containing protein (putative c-di-GMP-specific phosphodiesterase class I)
MDMGLRHALANSEFCLYYQPKVAVRSRAVRGFEALLRWNRPLHGMTSPAEFIPIAEESGVIGDIGNWVIDEVCRQTADWHANGHGWHDVSINVSAKQIRDNALGERIVEACRRHGVPPAVLEVELTESAVMANPDEAARIFQTLRTIGVKVAADDFGTGYSSLAYLRRLPIDVLKIDRSFVKDADKNDEDAQIIRTILALAKTLRLAVVAEGVETEAQATLLEEAGCDLLQGFLFSRPLPPMEIERGWRAGIL